MFRITGFLVVVLFYVSVGVLDAASRIRAAQEPVRSQAGAEHYTDGTGVLTEGFWQELGERKHLLGDAWGLRPALSDHGIGVDLTYVTNIAGNPVGGVSRGFTETDSTGLSISADFEKMAGLEGLTGFVSMAYRQGTSLTLRRIHNVVSVQQVYGGQTFHLVNLYLQQEMLDNRVSLKVGRIAQFDDFSHDFAFGYYMNNAFDGQPVGFFYQGSFTAYPTTTWGSIVKWGHALDNDQGVYAFLGAYGADTRLGDNAYKGARFSFDFNRGANIMAELGYKRNWVSGSPGLPGKYAVGAWWFTGDFPVNTVVPANVTKSGIGGFYYMLHQGLYREGGQEMEPSVMKANAATYWGDANSQQREVKGLFVWTTGQFAGASTSQMDVFVSAGSYYRGLIPGRDQDVLALGYYYGFFSDDLAAQQQAAGQLPQNYETAVELGYRYYVTDYFYLQPNVQAIFNPGGRGDIKDALVLGAQIEVDF